MSDSPDEEQISNNIINDNGKLIFKRDGDTYSTIHANNYGYIVFDKSINAIRDAEIDGRLIVCKRADFSSHVIVGSDVNSDCIADGALTVEGGAAIKKNTNIGENLTVLGHIITDSVPTADNHVTNKKYVDEAANQGFHVHTVDSMEQLNELSASPRDVAIVTNAGIYIYDGENWTCIEAPMTTSNITEGDKLFYTDDRVSANSSVQENTTHRLSNIAHGTTSVIVGVDDHQTLKNKKLDDISTKIVSGNKALMFNVSDSDPNRTTVLKFNSTGNREILFPDASGTLVTANHQQSMTHKTLTHTSNDIVANKLRTDTGTVNVCDNTPSPGQVLTATSASAAKWQTSSGMNTIVITLCPFKINVPHTEYTTATYFPWFHSRYGSYSNGTVIFRADIYDRDLYIRLYDATNDDVLGGMIVTSTGSYAFIISNPTSDSQIELQVRKDGISNQNPNVYGVILEFTV